ncbi:MAG: hypothetical protein GY801_50565 [bacterium]|nr:hypothetical protein [bacterium]
MISNKKPGQISEPARKRKRPKTEKLSLTPEIQALYFQCLAGKLHSLNHEDQRLIIQVFDRQFPVLQREARRFSEKRQASFLQSVVNFVLYVALMILTIAVVMLAWEYYANAEVSSDLIRAAQEHAEDSMRQAWQEGSEEDVQPVDTLAVSDGSIMLTQNAPRQIVTLPDGEPGLSDRHTTITVIQQPTPIPVAPPQKSSIQTTVNGIDRIETQAILPEQLAVDQMEALKKIADNGTLIAQQRFGLEQYKLNQEMELEYLRLVKSFVLWGFLASIPFLLASYWIFKNVFSGYRTLQNDRCAYRLKELEVTDSVIYDKVPPDNGRGKS